jgi:hypothetical protein
VFISSCDAQALTRIDTGIGATHADSAKHV